MIVETFNPEIAHRCVTIAMEIFNNWRKTSKLDYIARATAPIHGIQLTDLKSHYFTVGVGEKTTDVPFVDMLAIFTFIAEQNEALRKKMTEPSAKHGKGFKPTIQVTSVFSDDDAVALLSTMRIETPHDPHPVLRVSYGERPSD